MLTIMPLLGRSLTWLKTKLSIRNGSGHGQREVSDSETWADQLQLYESAKSGDRSHSQNSDKSP